MRRAIVVLALTLAGCGGQSSPSPAATAGATGESHRTVAPTTRRVGALGDSNTAGTCCGITRPWVTTLAGELGPTWEVLNYGVNYDTTALALQRWREAVPGEPSDLVNAGLGVLVVFVGINDVRHGVTADVSVANLGAIFDDATSRGVIVIPVTVLPDALTETQVDAWLAINYFEKWYAVTHGLILIETQPAFTDGIAGMDRQWGDGLHLNDAGQDRLADLVRTAFP